jgi:hypothetical protein
MLKKNKYVNNIPPGLHDDFLIMAQPVEYPRTARFFQPIKAR